LDVEKLERLLKFSTSIHKFKKVSGTSRAGI
jgi:hypothetical protein